MCKKDKKKRKGKGERKIPQWRICTCHGNRDRAIVFFNLVEERILHRLHLNRLLLLLRLLLDWRSEGDHIVGKGGRLTGVFLLDFRDVVFEKAHCNRHLKSVNDL